MRRVKLGVEWIDKILPAGMLTNTSTLVSGPGGSGKPLIGYIFASGWLRKGGNVVFMLTSTTLEYLVNTMRVLNIDLGDYYGNVFFIELDPVISDIKLISDNHIKANFIKPKVWDESTSLANIYLSNNSSDIGTMIVGAALNLLFFSPTYGEAIYTKIKEKLERDKSKTYFFTVNTDIFKERVRELEVIADNLMFSRMEKPMKIYLKIARMRGVPFKDTEVEVPLSNEVLESIRKEAERGKKNLIPAIKRL